MNTFEITVQRRQDDAWPVVVEYSQPGVFLPVRSEGTLQIDEVKLREQPTPLDYGTVLGKALFRDRVRDAFVSALRESKDDLRVLLFVEADDLKILRWERLCAPLDGDWGFLALDQRVPFSLYLPSLTDRRFPPIGRRDLRALVVAASPQGLERYRLDHFDVASAVSSVQAALGEKIPCHVLAALEMEEVVGPPTLDALCERITVGRYSLLHIVAHGKRERGETILHLARPEPFKDPSDQVDPVSSTRLVRRLRNVRGARGLPHLAFLATCESASPEAEGALGGLAQRLVRELGMPAVVAMTEAVSVDLVQALAENFYRRLGEHGEVDKALVEASAGLAEHYGVTVPALYSRLGGRPLFSDTLDRPPTNPEIARGLSCVEEILPKRAPVLQQTFDGLAATLQGTLGADPEALSKAAREEREDALTKINQLCEEALDLSFNGLALGQEPPAYDDRCPFRGLYPFRVEDREFFFGRGTLVKRLKRKLAEHNFLPILGASGSGKSSLVLAGLIPALQEKEPDLEMAYLTPGSDPLAQLEASLSKVEDQPAVLVVDQFEELFTLCADEDERRAFLDRLLAHVKGMRVVITLRADFWGECAPYIALKEVMQAQQELIGPMDAGELRRAMEQQANKVGLRFEADLSNTILDDVQGEPGVMPLLQHALLELWKRRHGRWLLTREYREGIGGVEQAIARTADDVYEELSPGEQESVRDTFVRLTRLDEETIRGEERRDTRRRVRLGALVPAGSDPAVTKRLVERLAGADARLVVTSLNAVTGREEVEVAHEALIRHWPRLGEWLDEDRSAIRLRESINQAAQEWEEGDRHESLLVHRGGRLEDAEALAERPKFLNELELAYVDACVALREQEHRREVEAAQNLANAEKKARLAAENEANVRAKSVKRLRQWAVALAVVALVAAIAAMLAVQQRQRAQVNEQLAGTRAAEAETAGTLEAKARQDAQVAATAQAEARIEAERNEAEARSLALTAGAGQLYEEGHYLDALSLAVEANKIPDAPLPAQWKLAEIAYAPGIRRILARHELPVNSVAFSPDGEWALSGSCSPRDGECTAGELVLWDIETGEEIRSFSAHTDTVTCVAISPNGRTALSGSRDTTLILWDLETGEQTRQFRGHSEPVMSVAFSPDGRTALSGSLDDTLILWDLETGEEIRRFSGHKEGVMSVVFSPDGLTALSGSLDGTLILWDVDSGQPIRDFVGHENDVYSVAIGPGGRTALSGSCGIFDPRGGLSVDDTCSEGQIILWDVATGEPIRDLRGYINFVAGVAFGPNGQTALSAAYHDPTLIIWDLATGQPLRTISGAEGGVRSLAASPDGQKALTGNADGTVHVWDLSAEQPIDTIDLSSEYTTSWRFDYDFVNSTAFDSDNQTAMSTGCDSTSPSGFCESGKLVLWDLKTEQPIQVYRGHSADVARWPISTVALSPDGLLAVSVGCNYYDFLTCTESDFILWDLKTGEQLHTFTGHTSLAESVAFSPDGRMFLSGSCALPEPQGSCAQGEMILWDAQTGEQIQQYYGHTHSVSSVTFSPDGQTAISGSHDDTLILWDLETGEQLRTFRGHTGSIAWVTFSPDGETAMSASGDNTLILWDLETGEPLRTFIGHVGDVTCVAFSPDGQTAVSGSHDDTLILWDLETGDQLRTFTGHEKGVHSVAFGTEGKTVFSSSYDGTVIIWRVDSQTELVEWTNDNRAVTVPDCQTRELYGIEPKCDDVD